MIGDSLTEINVTSPTCFQEITEQTGFDVPAMFIDALEAARSGLKAAFGRDRRLPVHEHPQLARRERGPGLVGGQRLGHDHGDAVVRRGVRAKSTVTSSSASWAWANGCWRST